MLKLKSRLTLFLCTILFAASAQAKQIVKADSITISGASSIARDVTTNTISTVYGGIAGAGCTGDGNTTCDSCAQSPTPQPCNQTSVYGNLKITVSFQISEAISQTGTFKTALYVLDDGVGVLSGTPVTGSIANPTANSTIMTLQTTWDEVCGSGSSCQAAISGDQTFSRKLAFGVDSDGSGDIVFDELKTIPIRLHVIASGSANETQNFCTSAQVGACNITLAAGDQKAIVKTLAFAPVADSTGLPWDGVAFFPVPVPSDSSGDALAFQNFSRAGIAPIVKAYNVSTSEITDKFITGGGIENYQRYCFVYATRNIAGNIYRFVSGAGAVGAAPGACVTPSEVVGVLQDKHCFISTAAFGSDMAPEVQAFRDFRNQYLLTNSLGRKFIKFYYEAGPPAAEFISQNEFLRSAVRAGLYPVLGFVYLTLNYGIFVAILSFMVLMILFSQLRLFLFGHRKVMMIVFILILTPHLKAAPAASIVEPAPVGTVAAPKILTKRSPASVEKPATKSVYHAGAAEGLIRIKKDGTYIYDLKRSLRNKSSHLWIGQGQNPDISIDIEQKDASGNITGNQNFKFDDFYPDSSNLVIGYDYEWFPFIEHGKLGLQGGFSAMFSSGYGRLVASPSPQSEETFTFVTIPLTLGVVYRLEWKDKQILAPYVAGGGTYLVLAEKREDKSTPKFAGSPGFYASAGMMLNLAFLDADAGSMLDSEYGISNMWLTVEFKTVQVQASSFTFSNQYVNAGLSFDF